jgi:anthranilate/para-aminobenzoate synthase component II
LASWRGDRVFRNDKITIGNRELNPERIVICRDPPKEAGISIEVVKYFTGRFDSGVCLGHQSIGAAFGGYHTGSEAYTERLHRFTMTAKHLYGLQNLKQRVIIPSHKKPSRRLDITAWTDSEKSWSSA